MQTTEIEALPEFQELQAKCAEYGEHPTLQQYMDLQALASEIYERILLSTPGK